MTSRVALTVERTTKRRQDAEARVAAARVAQSDAIRAAMAAGVSVQQVAELSGLTTARVYQINKEASQ